MTAYVLACRFPVVDATVPLADLYAEADRQARVMAANRGARLVGKPRRRMVEASGETELLVSYPAERIDAGGSWAHALSASLAAREGRTIVTRTDTCANDGCDRPVHARGLCNACYLRSRRTA